MKKVVFVLVSLLLVGLMVASTSAQGGINPGIGNVNFTVMNISPSTEANVIASYIAQDGTEASSVQKVLQPQSSQGFPITESGLPDTSWAGAAIASADQEIVAFAQIKWEHGSSTDGKTAAAYNGFSQGAGTLYFPSLAARSGKQFSQLIIQSAEAASAGATTSFTIKFYDRNGNQSIADVPGTVNKGAQTTIDLLDDVSLPVTDPPGDGWLGSAVVESADPIAGVAVTHWQQYSAAYSAVIGGGQFAYLPSATRRLPTGTWLQYTAVIVQNLDQSSAADVTARWYDRNGNELYSFDDTIPANSSHGYNTRHTAGDIPNPTALHNALGADWNGSVVIESTSGADIVGIVNLQWTGDHPAGAGASAYYSEPQGYAEVFVPAIFRRVSGGTWLQYTGLIVQNVGATACSNFDVEWRNRDGDLLMSYQDSLNPNIAHGYNTKVGADIPAGENLNDLGSSLNGSVYINAPGCELIGIHNTVWPVWTDSTTYNLFGK